MQCGPWWSDPWSGQSGTRGSRPVRRTSIRVRYSPFPLPSAVDRPRPREAAAPRTAVTSARNDLPSPRMRPRTRRSPPSKIGLSIRTPRSKRKGSNHYDAAADGFGKYSSRNVDKAYEGSFRGGIQRALRVSEFNQHRIARGKLWLEFNHGWPMGHLSGGGPSRSRCHRWCYLRCSQQTTVSVIIGRS